VSAAVGLPRVDLALDGGPAPANLAAGLTQVRVQRRLNLPALCEIVCDQNRIDPDRPAPAHTGQRITLRVAGAGAGAGPALFDGTVTAVEHQFDATGGRRLRLRAYDDLHRLRVRQPLRVHRQVRFSELAGELTADAGIAVEAHADGPLWHHLVQFELSDLAFLEDVAARSALCFQLHDGTLHVFSLAGHGEAVTLTRGDGLLEVDVETNTAGLSDGVSTLAWDPMHAEMRSGQGADARRADEGRTMDPGDADPRTLAGHAVQTDDQATALAQYETDRAAAAAQVAHGLCRGDPRLAPGTRIDLRGIGEALGGTYVLTGACHTIDREQGYVVEFETRPPAPQPPRSGGTVATLGLVTDVSDPDSLGRVRVVLPAFGDLESDWLGVVLPAAGAGKGLVALPALGDRVLVLLVRDGDPAQALVLGGLYGADGPPEESLDGDDIRRLMLLTAGGQALRLDDSDNSLGLATAKGSELRLAPGVARLRNNGGSRIALEGKQVTVHASETLILEAPNGQIRIRAAAIDFEKG
jgi:phage baseplate assembly protein gpV/phage protein D